MKNKLFTLLTIIAFGINASAQECNCLESFDWMITTFKNNDAGFQYVIDKKGEDDYNKFTALALEKAKNITTYKDCQIAMSGWLHYFRSGHIYVGLKEDFTKKDNIDNSKTLSEAEIREKYKNEKTLNLTEKQLTNTLDKKQIKNLIEGIWTNGTYTIGIIADKKAEKKYTGFIIKADSVYWIPKQIKAEFMLNDDNITYTADFYMRDHSKKTVQAKFIHGSSNLLFLMDNYWKRVYPKNKWTKKEEILLLFVNSRLPFIEKLDEKTIYLRIPSFEIEQKPYIDSVLAKNDKLISTTPYLIIDIRNGTGGSDDSYSKIIPYLYTNPIRHVGMQLYATELNANAYENYAKMLTDTSSINYCISAAKKMHLNFGTFITMSEQNIEIDSSFIKLPFPQKVAIICNHQNGSTDEQFLIDANQSQKVKIFGRPTGGMLDISNMNNIDFPNRKFFLGYCMSKSFRIPDYCIDGVGIQPDYFIDDAIPEENWIEYTKTILENN